MHGRLNWFSWFILGLIILATKRYLQGVAVYVMNLLHVLFGVICAVLSIYEGFMALDLMGGIGALHTHGYFGLTVMIFTVIQLATGDITLFIDKCRGNKPWQAGSDKKLIATLHKWGGYLLLFVAHLTIFTGTFRYS